MDDRGALLFEYKPLPMSPMAVALLILFGIVFLLSPLAVPRELFLPPGLYPINGACGGAIGILWIVVVLYWPSPTRIYAKGIEVSLPAWRRMARRQRWFPWTDVRNLYPAAYEISGAAMSPFASSAGTLVHVGLGIETTDGRRQTVKFTPGSIRAFRGETPGFTYAMAAVREAFGAMGRPLVSDVRPYTDDDILRMHEEARAPLLGMATIVFAFFSPPAIVAGTSLLLASAGWAFPLRTALAVALAAVPPLASMVWTYGRSRRRNWLLGELAKHEEWARARAA